ncbi:MAG: GNAT family N-acetyltransferase [Lachnospiraceae bacterium]
MDIRAYKSNDCGEIAKLFYETVHVVNAKDYTKEQRDVWANGQVDLDEWNKTFMEHITVVAIEGNKIIGFGDMDAKGYLDRLYVHKDYQRRGVATRICDTLENAVDVKSYETHASITAKPFFENRGYVIQKEQQVIRSGVKLTNYVMRKKRSL